MHCSFLLSVAAEPLPAAASIVLLLAGGGGGGGVRVCGLKRPSELTMPLGGRVAMATVFETGRE